MSRDSAAIWHNLARKTAAQATFDDNETDQKSALKQALALHTKAITFDDKNAEYYHGRAGVYLALGDYRSALVDYHKAVEYAPMEKKEAIRKDLRQYHRELVAEE